MEGQLIMSSGSHHGAESASLDSSIPQPHGETVTKFIPDIVPIDASRGTSQGRRELQSFSSSHYSQPGAKPDPVKRRPQTTRRFYLTELTVPLSY